MPSLLPADDAWIVTLPALPSAPAAMDGARVYVPLRASDADGDPAEAPPATVIALDRESGETVWDVPVPSVLPPLIHRDAVLVASGATIHALDSRSGETLWSMPVGRPPRTPLLLRGALVLAVLDGDEIVAVDLNMRQVAWRRGIGESGPVQLAAGDEALYVATAGGRLTRVNLSDGTIAWERPLQGVLAEPAVHGNRVFVGSDASHGSLWAVDSRTGRVDWAWSGRIFGGDVVGSVAEDDVLYVVSKDNFLRGLDRSNGHERWKRPIARPVLPPRLVEGQVLVTGTEPTLSTFAAKTGTPLSTWSAPDNTLLEGAPLVDAPRPFRVAIVTVLRSGQVMALRSRELLFQEKAPAPLTALPGRALPREPQPEEPQAP